MKYSAPIHQDTPSRWATLRFYRLLFTEALVGLIFIGAAAGTLIWIAEILDWLGVITI